MTLYFCVVCKECWPEDDDAPIPFPTREYRDDWIDAHGETGHQLFRVWVEQRSS